MSDRYAVLISTGLAYEDGYDEFWNDTVFMWRALRDQFVKCYNIKDENIFILYGRGEDYSGEGNYSLESIGKRNKKASFLINRFTDRFVDFPASIQKVEDIFNVLKNKLSPDDELFIWTFGHGENIDQMSYLCFSYDDNRRGYKMPADSFARLIKDIKCRTSIICMQQCNSGGFINEICKENPNKNLLIMTSCDDFDYAKEADAIDELEKNITVGHGEFDYHLLSAIMGTTPQGSNVRDLIESNARDLLRSSGYTIDPNNPIPWDNTFLYKKIFYKSIYDYISKNSMAKTAQFYDGKNIFGRQESCDNLTAVWTYGDGSEGDIRIKFSFNFSELFKKEGHKVIHMYKLDAVNTETLLHEFTCLESTEPGRFSGNIDFSRVFEIKEDDFRIINGNYYFLSGIITADYFRRIIYFDGYVNHSLHKYCKIQDHSDGTTTYSSIPLPPGAYKKTLPEGHYFRMDSIKGLRCGMVLFSWL